jgi:ATP-binding cassette, subfamily F, member 3
VARSTGGAPGGRRALRRLAAERRQELDPLRRTARQAEETIARLTKEREALDRALALPQNSRTNGLELSAALKRRAELVRSIERAESEWLAAEEAIERDGGARG